MSLFGESKKEKEELEIIEALVEQNTLALKIIDKLTIPLNAPNAAALKAIYSIATKTGDIQIFNSNKINSIMAQTITVLPGQNTVPGQLVPVASDNTTVEPISTITAGSEVYTSSDPTIATVAAVTGGTEGQFAVTRVAGKSGTITVSYTALAIDGTTTITNVGGTPDTFIFRGQPTGVAAALTATYGTPS